MRSTDALSVFPATIDLASGDGNSRPNLSEMHPVTTVSASRHVTTVDHRMRRLSHAHQQLVNDAPRMSRVDEGFGEPRLDCAEVNRYGGITRRPERNALTLPGGGRHVHSRDEGLRATRGSGGGAGR